MSAEHSINEIKVVEEDKVEDVQPRKWLWKKFNTLVLSGSGSRSVSTLGALNYCNKHDMLDIHTYIGTSSGAIIGYLLSIGYNSMEILLYLCTNNIFNKIDNSNISSFLNGTGFYDFSRIQLEIEKMTVKKVGYLLTMEQLHKLYNKNLIIVTYNDTKQESVYIDFQSHPNLPVMTALRMSCNLPLVFDNFKYMGDYYIDGVFADNFPVNRAPVDTYTLGIDISTQTLPVCGDDMTLYNRVNNILSMSLFKQDHEKYRYRDNTEILIIKIDNNNTNIIETVRTPNILDLFSAGYRQCEFAMPYQIT